jgi:hypothetical protein
MDEARDRAEKNFRKEEREQTIPVWRRNSQPLDLWSMRNFSQIGSGVRPLRSRSFARGVDGREQRAHACVLT